MRETGGELFIFNNRWPSTNSSDGNAQPFCKQGVAIETEEREKLQLCERDGKTFLHRETRAKILLCV